MANAKGVDVSHWQSLSDWSPTGLSFVIAKASEGTTPDSMYQKHVTKARNAGLIVGAYAFNRNDVDMAAQVAAFAKYAGDVDLYFIDVEGKYAFSKAQAADFMSRFRKLTGKKIGLYHSASGYFDAGQDYDWVAHWGVTKPAIPWDFHQYRGSPLDLDQFNGTEAELRAFVANLKGGDMPTIAKYLPGYTAVVGDGARVRTAPTLSATTIRVTTADEKWTVVGWAKGDSYDGTTYWLCRWNSGRWEYTHKVNVTSGPTAPVGECPPDTTPFDQADIDAAVKAATDPLNAQVASLTDQLSAVEGELATVKQELAEWDAFKVAVRERLGL